MSLHNLFPLLVVSIAGRPFCPGADIDRMGGGRGFYDMLMSCGHLKDMKAIEDCTVTRFQEVAMSDPCGRCVAEFLMEPEHANQTHECSLSCNKKDGKCDKCKAKLGANWETRCRTSPGNGLSV
jgi:hypothetical protein